MEMERENYKMHADVEAFQPPGSFRSGSYAQMSVLKKEGPRNVVWGICWG